MEGNRTQGEERLAGSIHVCDVLLEPARGSDGAELAVALDIDCAGPARDGGEINAGDEAIVGVAGITDADGADISIFSRVADTNVALAGDNVGARRPANG